MAEVNWAIGLPSQTNPGQAFMDAYNQGMQRRKEQAIDAAMRALAANPEDPKAIDAYAQVDPRNGMAYKQQFVQRQQTQQADRRKVIGNMARMADTAEKWDKAVAILVGQYGIQEAAEYAGKFSPELRAATMAAAGVSGEADRPTAMQQNYEFLKGQNPELAEQYLTRQAEGGPIVANNGDGTFTIIPRSAPQQGSGPQPGAVEDGYRFKGGNPADPNAWEPVNGGPTPQASGTFQPEGH